ncbi:hypothetical protein D9M73_71960 [compost metagenome]
MKIHLRRMPRQFGDGAGHFHPGRAAANDHERQKFCALLDIFLAVSFGALECQQYLPANVERVVDRFDARRVFRPALVTKVTVRRAGRQYQ